MSLVCKWIHSVLPYFNIYRYILIATFTCIRFTLVENEMVELNHH